MYRERMRGKIINSINLADQECKDREEKHADSGAPELTYEMPEEKLWDNRKSKFYAEWVESCGIKPWAVSGSGADCSMRARVSVPAHELS